MARTGQKQSKVFVVTTGCYSGYSIKGIFSTEEKARQYMKNCETSEECWDKYFNDLATWTLDEALREENYTRHDVGIMLDTGEVREGPSTIEFWGIPQPQTYVSESVPAYKGRGIVRAESHISARHAMKLAVEARQAWMREHANQT